ncbi:MAG: hypothetical protein IJ759_06000 [Bacteroidales bacterium]|nr:hypothetical protein [Bacteroidales bacterium]
MGIKYYIITQGNKYVAGTVFKTKQEAEESIRQNPDPIEREGATVEEISDIKLFNHLMRWIAEVRESINTKTNK